VKSKEKSPANQLVELIVIVAVALGLALGIQAFLVKPYRIPSESMEPTLDVGQRVLVNRIGERFSDPEVGDVVVFHPPKGAEEGNRCGNPNQGEGSQQPCGQETQGKADTNFIKRVVAGPGDRIAIVRGHAVVNGERKDEDYIQECPAPEADDCNFPQAITVPEDHWYMMGDNRGASADSRFWGPVPHDYIIGGAFATYWPPKRIGLL
jgi:signal peptidase I